MKTRIIVISNSLGVGKSTLIESLAQEGPVMKNRPSNEALRTTKFPVAKPYYEMIEVPAGRPHEYENPQTDYFNYDGIIYVLDAQTPDLKAEMKAANELIDSMDNVYNQRKPAMGGNLRKPMVMFAMREKTPAPGDVGMPENYLIDNATRFRREVVARANQKEFHTECRTYIIHSCYAHNCLDAAEALISRIRRYGQSSKTVIDASKSSLGNGTLAERLTGLLLTLEKEMFEFFEFNKDYKAIKIEFLKRVLHRYEQLNQPVRLDVDMRRIVEQEFSQANEVTKLVLEKGLRSRVKQLIDEGLTADQKHLMEIMRYREELRKEAASFLPYPNKKLKILKADFLTSLINEFEITKSLHDAYIAVKGRYKPKGGVDGDTYESTISVEDVTRGLISKVKQLLDTIPAKPAEMKAN